MPPRSWKMLMRDMLRSAARIERYIGDLTFAEFAADELRVDGVVLNFAIIGEAATHIPPEVQSRIPEVPWRTLRGMRNLLVHAYFAVDLDIVWDTAHGDLPDLVAALSAVLAEDDEL